MHHRSTRILGSNTLCSFFRPSALSASANFPSRNSSHTHRAAGLLPRSSHPSVNASMTVEEPKASASVNRETYSPPLVSIAPMMDWTDVHFRQLARLLTRKTWLWTEMVVDQTIIHTTNIDRFLWFPPEQHPVVLQLGGSDPTLLRKAAEKSREWGYDEINLNCGCPSDRVAGAGCFGAAMMLKPEGVRDAIKAIEEASDVPVSVKCRIGVDDNDSYDELERFIRVVSEGTNCKHFIIHARKAYLNGLNPHENRTIPPLKHQWVWALSRDFPHLDFTLNGGISGSFEAHSALQQEHEGRPLYGVMIGRAAYGYPWQCLSNVDTLIYGAESNPAVSRRQVLKDYAVYADSMIGRWGTQDDGHKNPSVRTLARPILNLFAGEPKNKKWKQKMDEVFKENPATLTELLDKTLHILPDHVLDAPPPTEAWSYEKAEFVIQDQSGVPIVVGEGAENMFRAR